jgi:hypothetical protein
VANLYKGLLVNAWSKHPVRRYFLVALGWFAITASPLWALDRTWIGGSANWVDGGATTNWNPADEPDADDTAIFNTGDAVSMGSNNAILALTMSGGADLYTNNYDLDVNGLIQLSNTGTNLIVGGADSLLTADSITVNNLATLQLDGGAIQINEESGNGLLDINVGGKLLGHGTLTMTDSVAANTTLIVNDGFITAQRSPAVIFGTPIAGTLAINATDTDTRIDLDGVGEAGSVIVRRNQTLDVNVPLADIFNGSIDMFQNTKLAMSAAWILGAGATIDIDNGFISGTFPNPNTPAGTSTIAGASFSQNSGTINVVDTDGTLQFDAPFTMNGGTLTNNGLVVFNSNTTIAAAANFTMPTASSSLRVEANRTVNINQNNFNMDGGNAATNTITVNSGGTLNINTTDYDPDSATNAFAGTITLNGGSISVNTSDAAFVMDGVLNMQTSASGLTSWSGEPLQIGNDAGVRDADINVTGTSTALFSPTSTMTFFSDADVDVQAGATLRFGALSTVNFNTVNGGNSAEFTGAGTIAFLGAVNVNEALTLNMVGGTVDLDGGDSSSGNFINIDAPLVINAASLPSFGNINSGGGANTLDINNSVGTGTLTVNLDNANAEWTLDGPGVLNLVNDNNEATLLAGSDVNINGALNVTGDVRTTARLDIGSTGTVTINTAGQPLRLAGGSEADPNTIAGGTISGAGILGADTGKVLRGFGTITTPIDFDGTADLLADNGMLTLDGTKILDVETLGTADVDAVLNVTGAWNNNVTAGIQLKGGTLSGGTITNDTTAGISGHGMVLAKVINNTQLFASLGDTLIVQAAGNDNDWDGTTGTGQLKATQANLEIRDTGAAFGFTGTVSATNNHTVFANGFALDFNPGSTLSLASGGKYQATSSTDIGGTVNVGAGGATIEVTNNFFLTFETGSATTLNSNLTLKNNNINIEQGAVFNNGGGALVIPDGSHLVADNLANIGVLLDMQGAFRPGNFEGIGRVNLFDYQQSSTGELYVELRGSGLNQFDRLVASGDVVLDGYLNIDIDEVSPGVPFVPTLGQTFNIITGNTVTGTFDYADVSGMPAGLAFHINYLPNAVQLQVVNKPMFSADFDNDGDVDSTDLAIWRDAYNLNQLGDADGDNDSDGRDFLIWQRQFGSTPLQSLTANIAVPEPNTLLLLFMAGTLLSKRRVKGRAMSRKRERPERKPRIERMTREV